MRKKKTIRLTEFVYQILLKHKSGLSFTKKMIPEKHEFYLKIHFEFFFKIALF